MQLPRFGRESVWKVGLNDWDDSFTSGIRNSSDGLLYLGETREEKPLRYGKAGVNNVADLHGAASE